MKQNFDETMSKVLGALRRGFDYEDCQKMLVYLVFLKYIIDNQKLELNNKTLSIALDAQRMFDKSQFEKEDVAKLNNVLEDQYGFEAGDLQTLANFYFRVQEMRGFDTFKIIAPLSSVSFKDESKAIYLSLSECLLSIASNFGRLLGHDISDKSLSSIISKLIDVQDDDSFADLMYGLGLSTQEITQDKHCKITGYEINKTTAVLAKMILIISGKVNFEIFNADFTGVSIKEKSFDKIVAVPPIGMKIRELTQQQKRILEKYNSKAKSINCEVICALQALSTIKDDGKIVLTVAPSVTFASTIAEKWFRKLITDNYLTAVIQTASLYYGTKINTVILVLEKSRKTDEIVFVDATSNDHFAFYTKEKRAFDTMTNGGIEKIAEIVKSKELVRGISHIATVQEVIDNDYLLSPARYVEVELNENSMSTKEINEKIQEINKQIIQLLK